MDDNIMSAIFMSIALVISLIAFGIYFSSICYDCKKFNKKIDTYIVTHGNIKKINIVQSYTDGWFQTVVHEYSYTKVENKDLTLCKTGANAVKINNDVINFIDSLTITFEDDYVLEHIED